MNAEKLLDELNISRNDKQLYEKALRIIDFMKHTYAGEDLRFVSAYLFGSSKIIDRNSKLRALFNRFATVERPNIIYIRTDTGLQINGVSMRELTEKLHLCAFFGGDIKSLQHTRATVVVSENLSFFMSAKPNNAIFLYSKGFHLINSLIKFIERLDPLRLIHFGDADLEGLAIFEAFKKRLPDMEFYPDVETLRFILSRYRDRLPKNNQKPDGCSFQNSKEIVDLLEDNISVEQEFVHSLIYRKEIEKPPWMK